MSKETNVASITNGNGSTAVADEVTVEKALEMMSQAGVKPSVLHLAEIKELMTSGQIATAEQFLARGYTPADMLGYFEWQLAEIRRLEAETARLHQEREAREAARESLIAKAERHMVMFLDSEGFADLDEEGIFWSDDGEPFDPNERFPTDVLEEACERIAAREYGVQ